MQFHTYVLVSDEGFHNMGSCADLEQRLKNHWKKTTHFTKKGTQWRLIYSKEFLSRSDAMKYEKWLKSGAGREWLRKNVAGWSPLNESRSSRDRLSKNFSSKIFNSS